MVDWLAIANQLAQAKSQLALAQVMTHTLKDVYCVRGIYLFTMSADGRELVAVSQPFELRRPVTDFSSVLAHVLHEGKAKTIVQKDLAYWQDDVLFKQCITHIPSEHGVHISPLINKTNAGVFGLIVSILPLSVIAQNRQASSGSFKTHYEPLLSLFAHHWLAINAQQELHSDKGLLAESLFYANKLQQQVANEQSLASKLVGQSDCMQQLRAQIAKAAHSPKTVLIQGEIGVGKSVVAEQIHDYSEHKEQPFIVINCAYLGAFRLERALFGYVKDAFEGASKSQVGAFGEAKSGTLYLDDVEQLPLALQTKLMQVLSSGTYQQLGSELQRPVRCRLIASTTKHLRECVNKKTFRQDLLYRLQQFPIHVPNLAQRVEDISALAHYFIKQFNSAQKAEIAGLHYEVVDVLSGLSLAGNVRELQSIIEFGCTHVQGMQAMKLQHIEPYLNTLNDELVNGRSRSGENTALTQISNLPQALKRYEKQIIETHLKNCDGNRAMAAKSLGIPKRTLADKCIKMEIDV